MVKFDPSYDEAKAMLIESREDLKKVRYKEKMKKGSVLGRLLMVYFTQRESQR